MKSISVCLFLCVIIIILLTFLLFKDNSEANVVHLETFDNGVNHDVLAEVNRKAIEINDKLVNIETRVAKLEEQVARLG
jgi:hypothetical protein